MKYDQLDVQVIRYIQVQVESGSFFEGYRIVYLTSYLETNVQSFWTLRNVLIF